VPTTAEIRAEDLVYEVAAELGLTEIEVLGLDSLAVADGVLRRLRRQLKRHAGATSPVQPYVVSDPIRVVNRDSLLSG
jgi:hypothetical protein